MAEFICGGCVGEDGHMPGDPRPCGPLGNEKIGGLGLGRRLYKTSLEGLFIFCTESLGLWC